MAENQLVDLSDFDFSNLSKRMMVLMAKHIGKENAISKRSVFKHFFGNADDYNIYQQTYMWGKLLGALGNLRTNSKCFIITEQRQTDYYFWVLSTQRDCDGYCRKADNYIQGIQKMKKRAQRAVDEQWHKSVEANAKKVATALGM